MLLNSVRFREPLCVFLFLLSSLFLPPAHKTPSFDLWCFPSLQFCGNHLHGLFPEPARVIRTPIFRYACCLSTCASGILFYFVSKLNLFSCVTSAVFDLLGKVKKAMKSFVVRAQGYEAVHFQKQKQRSWSLPRVRLSWWLDLVTALQMCGVSEDMSCWSTKVKGEELKFVHTENGRHLSF